MRIMKKNQNTCVFWSVSFCYPNKSMRSPRKVYIASFVFWLVWLNYCSTTTQKKMLPCSNRPATQPCRPCHILVLCPGPVPQLHLQHSPCTVLWHLPTGLSAHPVSTSGSLYFLFPLNTGPPDLQTAGSFSSLSLNINFSERLSLTSLI